jgi:hypothetical protein
MKSNLTSLKSQLLCASLLLAVVASAIAGSVSSSYSTIVGNTNLGSSSSYNLSGNNSTTSAVITGTATASVTLFTKSSPLQTFSFTAQESKGVPTNNVSLVIGSFIVYSQTTAGNATWNKSTSQTFASANSNVNVPTTIGTVPVTVSASLSGTGAINMTSTLTNSTNAVALSGNVGTNVGGASSATVATKYGAVAKVNADLNIGHSTLNANAASDTTKTMSGTFTLSLDALNLSFLVQLNSATSGALLGSTNLGSFVIPARTFTLLSL